MLTIVFGLCSTIFPQIFSFFFQLLDVGRKDLHSPFTKDEYEIIIKSVQDLLESWTNQRLVLTSAYGIRLYNEGSILAPHVDRLPLVSSAIINVFQRNVTEPWMLEVIGHDGIAQNLTSKPGEIILYESASVIHGRPYPLKGEGAQYGSLFVHFEPLYHTMRHAQKAGAATNTKGIDQSSKNAFEKALQEQLQKPSLHHQNEEKEKTKTISSNMPFRKNPGYVWPEYDSLYDQRFYFEYEETVTPKASKTVFGKITAHQAASLGELSALKAIAKESGKQELFKADHNGWRPLHEAARSGNDDIVEYLLEQGAKVNERTNNNKGGNPLYWASKDLKNNAKAIALLKTYGGINMAPIDTKLSKQIGDDDKKDTNGNTDDKK
jgi:prolyl 4-hydroxylase